MQKPVQRMTLQEFCDELDWTRPAWDAANLDGVLAGGQPPGVGRAHVPSPAGRARVVAAPEQLLTSTECDGGRPGLGPCT